MNTCDAVLTKCQCCFDAGDVCSGYGMSSAAYSQPVTQASASYGVGQQQTAQYGPYGNRLQVCLRYSCVSGSNCNLIFVLKSFTVVHIIQLSGRTFHFPTIWFANTYFLISNLLLLFNNFLLCPLLPASSNLKNCHKLSHNTH